jgi:hypothetical protein
MHKEPDILGALHWVGEPRNPATRGRRLTAWQIATSGPSKIDGFNSITAAAAARGVRPSTMWALLAELRHRYGVVPPAAELAATTPPIREFTNDDIDADLPVTAEEK